MCSPREGVVENLGNPGFSLDTVSAFEERIHEISRYLFKGTVVDFDRVDLRIGGESRGY